MTEQRDDDAPAPAPVLFHQVLEELRAESAAQRAGRKPTLTPAPRRAPRAVEAPPLTRREKQARRRASFLRRWREIGPTDLKSRPRDLPSRVYAGVNSVVRSASGREARKFLERMPRTWRPVLEQLARRPGDGRELGADLAHIWSRLVVAAAWVMWTLGRRSKRNGFVRTVDGYTQGMLASCFVNGQRGKAYSRSRLFGTSYRRDVATCGPFEALERAGFMHWGQPRLSEANPLYVGPPKVVGHAPDGTPLTRSFAFAVYWVRGVPPPLGPPA